jgi:hypothetical protein
MFCTKLQEGFNGIDSKAGISRRMRRWQGSMAREDGGVLGPKSGSPERDGHGDQSGARWNSRRQVDS